MTLILGPMPSRMIWIGRCPTLPNRPNAEINVESGAANLDAMIVDTWFVKVEEKHINIERKIIIHFCRVDGSGLEFIATLSEGFEVMAELWAIRKYWPNLQGIKYNVYDIQCNVIGFLLRYPNLL